MISTAEIELILKANSCYRIVFLGDSLTSTEWVHPNWREIVEYVLKDQLQTRMTPDWKTSSWGIRCYNEGYDGATTADLLGKLSTNVSPHQPALVVFIAGGNDLLFNISIEEHLANLEKLTDKVVSAKSKLIMCTSLPSGREDYIDDYGKYASVVSDKFASDKRICYIDIYSKYRQFKLAELFTFISEGNLEARINPGEIDPLHPNMLGNAYIAKLILKDGFGIEFNPEKYLSELFAGVMYPNY